MLAANINTPEEQRVAHWLCCGVVGRVHSAIIQGYTASVMLLGDES